MDNELKEILQSMNSRLGAIEERLTGVENIVQGTHDTPASGESL